MRSFLAYLWEGIKFLFRHVGWVLIAFACVVLGFFIRWGVEPADIGAAGEQAAVVSGEHDMKETPTVWTCSMHPEVRMPEPGRCPKCGMKLIPMHATPDGEMAGLRRLTVSKEARALMDIDTATVERRFVTATVRMVGKIDYDETRVRYITAWVPGRLDRLYVDYTGVPVRKGDHLVYIYSPDLYSAQEELIQALRAVGELEKSDVGILRESTISTLEAAREKLRLWGLKPDQIAEIEKRGTPADHLTIYSPISGIVIHKNAQEGMYVETGTRIYTLADLSQVWVKLDAYESDLVWIRYGQKVEFTTVSYPGEVFTGIISFIDPVLDEKTRTVKVRVDAPNPDGKLKPEMFVKATLSAILAAGGRVMDPRLAGKWICPMHPSVVKDAPGDCDICGMPLVRTESLGYVSVDPEMAEKPLVIPVSAALVTGTRAIVYVEVSGQSKPTYEGREIVLGPRAGEYYIVRSGLKEGDRVVTKGNFKIDSALQIQAKPSMMTPEGGGGGGHMHGHGKSKAGTKPEAEVSEKIKLSQVVRHQLHAVLASASQVKQAVADEDLDKTRKAFEEFGKAVQDVEMSQLKGHAHMVWMEIAMRLRNDAVEGANVKTVHDASRVEKSLTENIASLQAQLGLYHIRHAKPTTTQALQSVTSTRSAPDSRAGVWTCPMHPEIQMSEPGECPKCGMNLIATPRHKGGEND